MVENLSRESGVRNVFYEHKYTYTIDIHNIIIINNERSCLKGHDYW
jgi:hypothetical protein